MTTTQFPSMFTHSYFFVRWEVSSASKDFHEEREGGYGTREEAEDHQKKLAQGRISRSRFGIVPVRKSWISLEPLSPTGLLPVIS